MTGALVVAATGLRREALFIQRAGGVLAVAGAGDPARLEAALEGRVRDGAAIASIGLAGALAPELAAGEWVIGTEVAGIPTDPAWRARAVTALFDTTGAAPHIGPVAAGDTAVATAAAKALLHAGTGALAVDMESHVAARVAQRHGLPFAIFRVISDDARHTLPPAALAAMRADGGINLAAVLTSLLRHPGQIAALAATARQASAAFRALGRVDALLGPGLGFPDFRELALDMA